MRNAYQSFNQAINAAWAIIAPTVPIIVDSQDDADALPPECLRIFWEDFGFPSPDQASLYHAAIDIAIRVPAVGNVANTDLALARGVALDTAIGIVTPDGTIGGLGVGRAGRMDWSTTPITYLNDMDITGETAWVRIGTSSPGQLHLAKKYLLTYRTY